MNTNKTYYKFNIQENNESRSSFVTFGYMNGNILITTDGTLYNLKNDIIVHKEELPFNPFHTVVHPYELFDEMLRNGLAVEIVTDLWADWEFDESGKPIKRTVSPVNGVQSRRAVWRPCYQYFTESERKYITDDGGTFDDWGIAFLESYHYYHSIKDKIYKGGFV